MPHIRLATRAELDTIIDWAAREGWNPGIDDGNAFWAADPEGYWVASRKSDLPLPFARALWQRLRISRLFHRR